MSELCRGLGSIWCACASVSGERWTSQTVCGHSVCLLSPVGFIRDVLNAEVGFASSLLNWAQSTESLPFCLHWNALKHKEKCHFIHWRKNTTKWMIIEIIFPLEPPPYRHVHSLSTVPFVHTRCVLNDMFAFPSSQLSVKPGVYTNFHSGHVGCSAPKHTRDTPPTPSKELDIIWAALITGYFFLFHPQCIVRRVIFGLFGENQGGKKTCIPLKHSNSLYNKLIKKIHTEDILSAI